MALQASNARRAARTDGTKLETRGILILVVAIFFLFGGITNLNDVLIPKLKGLFSLNYTQAMLVQFAFFTSYAIFSIPAGLVMKRLGYFRGIVLGFGIMALSCLLFLPAAYSGLFASFLAALFMLGGGITMLQVAVNPLILSLGNPETAHSRLTFAQFFNSVGVFLMVRFGAEVILGDASKTDGSTLTGEALKAYRVAETTVIGHSYIGLAIILALIAATFWFARNFIQRQEVEEVRIKGSFALLRTNPHLRFGVLCIFLYVGAEVAIASIMVNYLGEARTLSLDPRSAGIMLSYYWLGALVGRLVGGLLLRLTKPGLLLALFATAAVTLNLISAVSSGELSAYSLIAVGLANSIMFPTIFSLATEGLDAEAPQASGLLCTAIVGGAFIPLLTGVVADSSGLAFALVVPILCYIAIGGFGIYTTIRK
ncbi:MAG: sugar MFS transporter [Parasphingorhabdus sp.]|uniref:sugar MFS transporter n=1 Tax=Parasphingorhabdus sp. TaxID=2709688 RepID=UPI0030026DCE